MKRIIILVFVILYALATCGCLYADSEKYPYGRDTEVRVGEGRFDICRFGDVNNERYGVVDVDTQENIEDNVSKYYDYKRVGKLYLIGDNGYTVIDYEKTKTYEQHTDVGEFSEFDKKVFNNKWFDVPGSISNTIIVIIISAIAISLLATVLIIFLVIIIIKKEKPLLRD